jgi:hypothetical protein
VLWLLFVWHFGGCLFYYLAEFVLGGLLLSEKCFLFYYALYPDLEEKMLFDLREMFASHDCQVNVLPCISLMLMLWFLLTCTLA